VLVDLAVLVSFIWPHRKVISQKKRMKYLEEDNIIVRVRSIVQVGGRRVTGARGVRPSHFVPVPNYKRIRILVVPELARGLERGQNLGCNSGEARLYLRKIKSVYSSKVYLKHHLGFPKLLLQEKGSDCD
jgi:hypothetical protein